MKTIPQISVDALTLGKRFCKLTIGEEMSYDEINSIVPGRDVQNGGRGILCTARNYAQREASVVVEVVHGKGIKRLGDGEISELAEAVVPKLRKICSRTARKISCADYDKLNPGAKTKYNAGLSVLGVIQQFTTEKARAKISEAVNSVSARLSFDQTIESTKKLFSTK